VPRAACDPIPYASRLERRYDYTVGVVAVLMRDYSDSKKSGDD